MKYARSIVIDVGAKSVRQEQQEKMQKRMSQIYGTGEQTMNEIRLKPCPFCGGEGCLQEHIYVGYTNRYGVVCLDCGVETRQFSRTKEDAVEVWNSRTNEECEEREKGRCLYYAQ